MVDGNGAPCLSRRRAFKDGGAGISCLLKKRGVRLSVATACAPELYIPALKRLGIYGWFDAYASLHEVAHGKSEPDVYLLAASGWELRPESALFLTIL